MRQPSVFVCELRPHEGVQLKRIARTAKQFARRQRAQILLASASGMSAPQIAAVVRTDENQVRRVIHEFNMLGMDSLRPRAGGGRPLTIDQPTRDRVVAIALACPCVHGEPLNRWSLRRLRRYLLRRRILGHISVEGLRQLLRRAGASWQRTRTWKTSPDPDYEAKASRILRLYRAAEGGRAARHGCVVVCLDECGPLSLRPCRARPGHPQAALAHPGDLPAPAWRALPARLLRRWRRPAAGPSGRAQGRPDHAGGAQAHPCPLPQPGWRLGGPGQPVGPLHPPIRAWARANRVRLVPTPTYASYLNRIECHFWAFVEFVIRGSDYAGHDELAQATRGYLRHRNSAHRDARIRILENRRKVA